MYYHLKATKYGWQLVALAKEINMEEEGLWIPDNLMASEKTVITQGGMRRIKFPNFLPGYWTPQQVTQFVRSWELRYMQLWNTKSMVILEKRLELMVKARDQDYDNPRW